MVPETPELKLRGRWNTTRPLLRMERSWATTSMGYDPRKPEVSENLDEHEKHTQCLYQTPALDLLLLYRNKLVKTNSWIHWYTLYYSN